MSERFSRIYSLPQNLYIQGSPIIIKAGALLKDNNSNSLIAQLKFQNITNEIIKLVKVEITCLDSLGRQIDKPIIFDYLDLSATRGEFFGTKTPIKITNLTARSFAAKVVEVGFLDNTVWKETGKVWEEIPRQTSIEESISNKSAVVGYKSIFGESAAMVVCEYADLWICTCGKINHKSEEKCHNCDSSLFDLKNIDVVELEKEGIYFTACEKANSNIFSDVEKAIEEFSKIADYKDSNEHLNLCNEKIEELKKQEKIKLSKRRKLSKLSSFIAGGIVLLGLLGYFVFYPLISFVNGIYAPYINMYDVKEFEVPDSVTSIDSYAFDNCSSLTSITIPDSVTSIGSFAFWDCSNLTNITIPDSVTSINYSAFSGCSSLTSVVIGDGVTSIDYRAFYNCDSLTSVVIGDGVTSIGDDAFIDCSSLMSVVIGDGVTSIGSSAFYNCDSLTSITIPDSVTSIGSSAFSDCSNLTSITIPDSVTIIGEHAFRDCSSLTSITIPDSVTSIGSFAFSICSSLRSIKYRGTQTQWNAISKGDLWNYKTGSYTITYNYTEE